MKKLFVVVLLLALFASGTVYAQAGLLERELESSLSAENYAAPDLSGSIPLTWEGDRAYFTDADGNRVYAYLPFSSSIVPRGRELIWSTHSVLSGSSDYYERLYSTKSTTPWQFKEYVTSSWIKTSGYTVSTSKVISWSHSGSISYALKRAVVDHYGLNYSMSTASASGSLYANPELYSRLGLFVKYVHNDIQHQELTQVNGVTVSDEWEYGATNNPSAFKLQVVYQ
ncbi:MAG: hypothetical protein PHI27_09415 [Eubacteriales bacterium]|nr:hypothetical protein [Eubacteriales bacterium]MDD3882459.1 hypothetical protein [Eubacteriales bacterium]MDD4513181.1 hypothetical protein [Eubacteriales bacterium]